ncbi:hypothetical protein [Sphingomonas bacterium]|nr:hypothetical protein [Sphingomonas bacterium]
MIARISLTASVSAVIAVTMIGSPLRGAGGYSPEDRMAMGSYVLTTSKMVRWISAESALKAAQSADPELRADEEDLRRSNGDLAQLLAAMRRHPRFTHFFRRAGLSDRDAVLFPVVIANAAVAALTGTDLDGEASFSTPPQIAFYRAHHDELDGVLRR